jgi:hypothetical protein
VPSWNSKSINTPVTEHAVVFASSPMGCGFLLMIFQPGSFRARPSHENILSSMQSHPPGFMAKRKVGPCSHLTSCVCACAGVLEGRSSDRKLLEFGSVGRRSLRAIRIYLNRRRRLDPQTVTDSWTSCLNSCTSSSSNEDAMIVSLRVLIGRLFQSLF